MRVVKLRPRLRAKPFRLKGIKRVKKILADGTTKVFFYHRATGTALDPNNLVQSYAAAEKKKLAPTAHPTFMDLILRFENLYLKDLSDASKDDWAWRLKVIKPKWGTVPIAAATGPEDSEEFRRDVLLWHEELGRDHGKRYADAIVAGMARIFSYALEKSVIRMNPLTRFKRLYKNDRSELTWSDGLVADFLRVAREKRPEMVTAMYIVRHLGQRQKSIRELPWTAYDGTTIDVWQSKGRKTVRVKCTRDLKSYLDGLPRTGPFILSTPTGRQFTKNRFSVFWSSVAKEVGVDGLHFHDLRGTAATRLAEAGCSAPQIASVMGWTIKKAQQMIDTYVATSGVLAAAAIEKLEEHLDKQASRTFREPKLETDLETENPEPDK